jgi:hypothetical protein
MHRLPRAAATVSVLMGLAAALLAPGATLARAPLHPPHPSAGGRSSEAAELARHDPDAIRAGTTNESCTGWQSTYVPPPTINVLRYPGQPKRQRVDVVPFKQYVLTAMLHEWPESMPYDALKIGAIAVKQYGWYYTIVYRGGIDDGTITPGVCYDVVDTTTDQIYRPPPTPPVIPNTTRAVNETWRISLRKYSSKTETSTFFLTGYRAGTAGSCGFDADAYKLMQASLVQCIHDGLDFEQTLRVYLDPRLEIVKPGAHNVIGTLQGDGTALALTGSSYVPHIYAPSGLAITTTSDTAVTIPAAGLRGTATVDINRDGFDDLLTMSSTGHTSVEINAALSDKHGGYGTATTWWAGDIGVPAGNALLLVADFNGDGYSDAGILVNVPGPTANVAELLVVEGHAVGPPSKPIVWWSGTLDRTVKPRIFAADVNGDGAADLLVMQPYTYPAGAAWCGATIEYPGGPGSRLLVVQSSSPTAGLSGAPVPWCDLPDVSFTSSAATVGDFNRDGRDDLAVAYTRPDGSTHIDVIRMARLHVKRFSDLWTRPSGYPATQLRLGSADVDLDGMSDLVLYRGLKQNGTQIVLLHGDYTRFTALSAVTDPTLTLATARLF